MAEPQVFLLPDVGEGLTEADIVTWHVGVGDTVALNDVLVDVETAKSVVELPSPYEGTVLELHAPEGATLAVGAQLISIGAPIDPEAAAPLGAPSEVEAVTPSPTPLASPLGSAVPADPGGNGGLLPGPGTGETSSDAPLILVGTGPTAAGARRVHLTRPEQAPYGRVRNTGPSPAPRSSSRPDGDVRTPVKGVRRATAQAMVRSAFSAPHATMWTTVDVSATTALISRLRGERSWADVRVSPLLMAARTTVLAVRDHPEINASWDEAAQEIVVRRALNLGIAAATPRGLMVPNIKDAGVLTTKELARELDATIARARAGKLTPEEMSDGTLTLTNVGTFGVEGATPILNPPEAAILALGAIEQRPWVVRGAVEVRDVMTISISIDHRVVDGELGAKVLRHVAGLLSEPARALL